MAERLIHDALSKRLGARSKEPSRLEPALSARLSLEVAPVDGLPSGDLKAEFGMARKGWKRRRGVRRIDVRIVGGFRPRQRVERQPITHGRIAGDQITVLATQKPRSAAPASARRVPRHRQGIADDLLETLREYPHQALAFEWILEPRIERIDVGRQSPLAP